MPLLGGLLVWLFGGLASFLAEMFGKKVGVGLAFVASLGGVVLVLLGGMRLVVEPLAGQLFAYPYAGWMGLAFPPVSGTCMVALGATWAATVLYRWQLESLRLAASA